MRWLWSLCWDPLRALDLVDAHGRPDHGKLVGFIAFLAVWALLAVQVWRGTPATAAQLIILVTPIFGWVAWRTFLRSKIVTAQEQVTAQLTAAIGARRAVGQADGVEPTP